MKKGWTTKPLGDVATVAAGNSAPQDEALFKDGSIPFFRTADAGRVRFGDILESEDYLNERGAAGLRRFQKGTILFPKSGASTFLNHRVMLGVEGCVSSHLATIVADEAQVHPRFLLYFLFTVEAQDLVQDHAYPSLNLPTIAGIQVRLPALPEQQRIVGVLDEAFAGLATAQAHAAQNLQNARALFESHLQSVFTHRGKGWLEKTVGGLVSDGILAAPIDGNHGEIHPKKADFVASGVPFIMASDLENGGVNQEDCAFISRKQADSLRKGFAKDGDVLLSHKGTIGRVAILRTDHDYVMLTPQVTYYRVTAPEKLLNRFLYFALQAPDFVRTMNEIAGAGSTRAYIGILKQQELPLAFPGIGEQKRLADQLEALAAEAQRLTQLYKQKQAALAALKKSLLHQAFTGEL